MKVVLDTNIFISGTFWDGSPRVLIETARENKFEVFVSIPILQEVYDTLTGRKFGLLEEEAFRILRDIQTYAKLVFPTKKLCVVEEDPADDKIFECAVESGATIIISGDKHLLKIGEHGKILVYTVQNFLAKFLKI